MRYNSGAFVFLGLDLKINNGLERESVVAIAIRYGIDGPGIECRRGRDFPRLSRPALGLTQAPVQWVLGLFTGCKAAGAWR